MRGQQQSDKRAPTAGPPKFLDEAKFLSFHTGSVGSRPTSGLCREGRLEIGVQQARKLRPDPSDGALLALAKTVNGHIKSPVDRA